MRRGRPSKSVCKGNHVRNKLLAMCVAGTLLLANYEASAEAASKSELRAMEVRMEALAERLNRLEAANASLRSENAELKAAVERRATEAEQMASQAADLQEQSTQTAADLEQLKQDSGWTSRIKLKGDLRYRMEGIWLEDTAERKRHRGTHDEFDRPGGGQGREAQATTCEEGGAACGKPHAPRDISRVERPAGSE